MLKTLIKLNKHYSKHKMEHSFNCRKLSTRTFNVHEVRIGALNQTLQLALPLFLVKRRMQQILGKL
jgi:hypothetical protein